MNSDRRDLLVGAAIAVALLAWAAYAIPRFERMERESRGCAPKAWRNPVTGREERIGPWPDGCRGPSGP